MGKNGKTYIWDWSPAGDSLDNHFPFPPPEVTDSATISQGYDRRLRECKRHGRAGPRRRPRAAGSARNLLLTLPALLVLGCRLPGNEGPVPESLAMSRQLTQRGVAALEQGHPAQAKQTLAEAVRTSPVDPDARRHYAESLWEAGDRREAVAQMDEAVRLTPGDARVRVRLAEMQLATGDVHSAQQNAGEAIDRNPKLAPAWAARARVMRALGQSRRALGDCHRALALAPDNRDLLMMTAELYRHLNQPQRALGTLHTLADTYLPGEEPHDVLVLQGFAYVALGRYDDAARAYQTALAKQPASPEVLYHLAEVELMAGRPAAAAAAAREALALEPEHRESLAILRQVETAAVEGDSYRR